MPGDNTAELKKGNNWIIINCLPEEVWKQHQRELLALGYTKEVTDGETIYNPPAKLTAAVQVYYEEKNGKYWEYKCNPAYESKTTMDGIMEVIR